MLTSQDQGCVPCGALWVARAVEERPNRTAEPGPMSGAGLPRNWAGVPSAGPCVSAPCCARLDSDVRPSSVPEGVLALLRSRDPGQGQGQGQRRAARGVVMRRTWGAARRGRTPRRPRRAWRRPRRCVGARSGCRPVTRRRSSSVRAAEAGEDALAGSTAGELRWPWDPVCVVGLEFAPSRRRTWRCRRRRSRGRRGARALGDRAVETRRPRRTGPVARGAPADRSGCGARTAGRRRSGSRRGTRSPRSTDHQLGRAAADVDDDPTWSASGRSLRRTEEHEGGLLVAGERLCVDAVARSHRAVNSAPLAASRTAEVSTATVASAPCSSIAARKPSRTSRTRATPASLEPAGEVDAVGRRVTTDCLWTSPSSRLLDVGDQQPGRVGADVDGGHAHRPSLVRWSVPAVGLATIIHAAGWSSLVARRAHNPKVAGSNPAPAIENPPLARRVFVSGE